ncbi:28S ribosomal protein S10, mitochondrial [Schistocerca piceifrons]|uniref:28S ribosomal protein S10, mitochondrial n=1 Tax=Schistocerca piceifrons TaxID=274613 RepID=UPI001F5EC634|nr:28S ribosomal protein S10, mitochondrial [Schistocerca piceifrons]
MNKLLAVAALAGKCKQLLMPLQHDVQVSISSRLNLSIISSFCTSTNPVTTKSALQEEELDKLYKILEIEVRGNDPAVLKSYETFATMAARELGITVGECWSPRKAHHERLTLLKSIHIYKKHRVQYEVRTYFRFMQFLRLTGSTADTFLEYIQRNLPEGVAMKATRVEVQQLPTHLHPTAILKSLQQQQQQQQQQQETQQQ